MLNVTMRRTAMLVLISALTACGGGGGGDATPTPTATAASRPSTDAEIEILQPTPGAVVDGTSVPVEIDLIGAELIEESSTEVNPKEGHIHLALDGETLTLLGGLEEDLAELAGGPLEPGQHVLEAEFVAADHGFFIPRVIATVTFTVE
jgi:hypothetical protein